MSNIQAQFRIQYDVNLSHSLFTISSLSQAKQHWIDFDNFSLFKHIAYFKKA